MINYATDGPQSKRNIHRLGTRETQPYAFAHIHICMSVCVCVLYAYLYG